MSTNTKLALLTIALMILLVFVEQLLAPRLNAWVFTIVVAGCAVLLVAIVAYAQRYWRARE